MTDLESEEDDEAVINASVLLESLRWKEDMLITNHDGERVWLKPCFNAANKRIGITDCCPADTPCEWHAALLIFYKKQLII